MNVYIGVEEDVGVLYDYIFTMPFNDNLYTIEKKSNGDMQPEYNYGREIFRRRKE